MPEKLTDAMRLMFGLLPASRAKNRVMSALGAGWTIAPTAALRPAIYWRVRHLSLAEEATIGFGNILRDLRSVTLDLGATLGPLNWVSAAAHIYHDESYPEYRSLHMGASAAVTSRHRLDCSGGISVGDQSTIAGYRSTLISHGPDLRIGVMEVAPIKIGRRCFVSTNVVIVKGCTIADRVVISAGSVVSRDLSESDSLYASPPTSRVASMADASYFTRRGLRIDENSDRPVTFD